ncbi:MAG: hypothetical protein NUV45_03210 [Tepidanaerobacteraceae bacterium]|nr:hypothetical protein [Tepidanaerobacteraceae bacterium]
MTYEDNILMVLEHIQKDLKGLKETQSSMHDDIRILKETQSSMQDDIRNLKETQSSMQDDIHNIQTEIRNLKETQEKIDSRLTRLEVYEEQITKKIETLVEVQQTYQEINERQHQDILSAVNRRAEIIEMAVKNNSKKLNKISIDVDFLRYKMFENEREIYVIKKNIKPI